MPYSENVEIIDSVREGVTTKLSFEGGDSLVVTKSYDAEPHLDYAKQARDATAGQRWGDGKLFAHIPNAHLAQFLAIRDPQERSKALWRWLRDNPKFCMFDRALKVPA